MIVALALLLKAPRPGEVKTRLAAEIGTAPAVAVYRGLVARQLRALPPGWPAIVHFAPPGAGADVAAWLDPLRSADPALAYQPQPDGDLGVRIAAAFDHGFAAGTGAVIVLGGDCPALDADLLHEAAARLAAPDTGAVIGPATDGGFYLLGLRPPRPDVFAGIPWSTDGVCALMRHRLRQAGLGVAELPALGDVDTAADWRAARSAGLLPD